MNQENDLMPLIHIENDLLNVIKDKGYEILTIDPTEIPHYYNPFEGSIMDADEHLVKIRVFFNTLRQYGYEGANDLYHCITNIDLTDADKRRKFELWRTKDVSKQGLMEI
ncbi:hypothetical protein JOD82_001792 [Paenibacillus sp. 1182]|uniref:hypothetical protein n=1 Tax=Paenibacillus sp. 1182 TaxID=2806565 RepID=UPI001AE910C0|nr:hypothetical protein [Paenibacillus sp. 1182]MBP1308772.1 hypothetical protein [Paenibacillus sp. 1182]